MKAAPSGSKLQIFKRCQLAETLAQAPIPNLVVVLWHRPQIGEKELPEEFPCRRWR